MVANWHFKTPYKSNLEFLEAVLTVETLVWHFEQYYLTLAVQFCYNQ